MRQIKFAVALLAATALASCGGGGGGDQSTKVKFSSQVSFGDSLSDVGTYNVGAVKALGGGKWTINNVGADGVNASKNWTELMAAQFGLPAPCAAQTGLESVIPGFPGAPITNVPGCTSYAQGSARVTNPVGPGNKALLLRGDSTGALGLMGIPIIAQIQNHLAASGGKFKGDEIVFVMAGGNDAGQLLDELTLGATAAATAAVTAAVPTQIGKDIASGVCVPTDAQASNCVAGAVATLRPTVGATAAGAYVQANAPGAVTAMGVAGAELAGYVKTLIVGNGAKYVTVVNLPDGSNSPGALLQDAATRGLINTMTTTFNTQLKAGLDGNANVLLVDAYTVANDQVVNPAPYGLTNVQNAACDLTPAKNPLGSSLTCTASTLIAGVTVSDHYLFADNRGHPTPYGYLLLARFVSKEMAVRGWL